MESGLVSRYLCSEPSACAAAPGAPASASALDAASHGATGAVFGAAGSQGSRETDAGQDLVLHFTELGKPWGVFERCGCLLGIVMCFVMGSSLVGHVIPQLLGNRLCLFLSDR